MTPRAPVPTVVLGLVAVAAFLLSCGGGQTNPPLAITTASLSNGIVQKPYTQTIQSTGGVAPFQWTVSSGSLPHQLVLGNSTLNRVTVSGTPDTPVQAVPFTIKVTDSGGHSAAQPYTVSILLLSDTLTLSPGSLTFAPQLVGSPSSAKTETLTNIGSSELNIASIGVVGNNAAEFNQISSTCGSTLVPGASCEIHITFKPSQLGPRSASVAITDNTGGSPQSLALTGTGITPGPNATLSTIEVNFAAQNMNTTGPAQAITLSNYGTAVLGISSITASADFGESDNCIPSLASAASCTINITFTPAAAGAITGSLSITDNANTSSQTVTLNGTGTGTSQALLTGECVGQSVDPHWPCQGALDTSQCPTGQPASTPEWVECSMDVMYVDTSRSCKGRTHSGLPVSGYCAVAIGAQSTSSGAKCTAPR